MPPITRCRVYCFLFLMAVLTPFYIKLCRMQGNFNTEWRDQKFYDTENEQNRRKLLIDKTCQFLKINQTLEDIPSSYLDHFIVDDTHKLIYCFVPKVACTNWKRILLTLRKSKPMDPLTIAGNETHQVNIFKTLNQYSSEEIKTKLKSYWKFAFTRHPYERILSAYRNKLEDSYVNYFRIRFGTEIIKKFRTNPSKESLEKGHDVRFAEFVQYITSLSVIEWKKAFNEHWRPVFDLCFPCHIKYDFIGKYETLVDDANFILEKTGVSKYVKFPERLKSYPNKPTRDVMQSYYRNLSTETHRKLFEIYKEDFTLFEYDIPYL
ncbi:carbohydrate sulfotransferase 11 [Parasteatoda tepidariorum]|uniref:carbohydrate sulfotransferase 11 n=1 Tax=Parasteatoda tepidariorum TaxID=114398 RepID=UPI00077FC584|nr:carbohydrate sulfotransferase 11 isoform X1 [Parasteatoda tepidariorum]